MKDALEVFRATREVHEGYRASLYKKKGMMLKSVVCMEVMIRKMFYLLNIIYEVYDTLLK